MGLDPGMNPEGPTGTEGEPAGGNPVGRFPETQGRSRVVRTPKNEVNSLMKFFKLGKVTLAPGNQGGAEPDAGWCRWNAGAGL